MMHAHVSTKLHGVECECGSQHPLIPERSEFDTRTYTRFEYRGTGSKPPLDTPSRHSPAIKGRGSKLSAHLLKRA